MPQEVIAKTLRFLLKRDWRYIFTSIIFLSLLVPVISLAYSYYQQISELKKQAVSGESEKRIYYPVTEIIDGDTIVIEDEGKKEQIRLLGINTPEIGNQPECYGLEAKQKMENLLTNQKVFLLADFKNTNRDIYGRLLRYVYLEDNTQINGLLVKEGYARVYDHFSLAYFNYFKKLELKAKTEKKGLWKNCATPNYINN